MLSSKMRSTSEIGLKITAATREYYRYTGISAELERRGASPGPSLPPTDIDCQRLTAQTSRIEPEPRFIEAKNEGRR